MWSVTEWPSLISKKQIECWLPRLWILSSTSKFIFYTKVWVSKLRRDIYEIIFLYYYICAHLLIEWVFWDFDYKILESPLSIIELYWSFPTHLSLPYLLLRILKYLKRQVNDSQYKAFISLALKVNDIFRPHSKTNNIN